MGDLLDERSRRAFIGHVVKAGAGAGLAAAVPRYVYAQECEPPGSPRNPTPFASDRRPSQPRRPASTLSASEIKKLQDAYGALRELAAKDPTDPRGFSHQANIHCFQCGGGGGQIHNTWLFFAWHRAELYFHERILGGLIGDPDFRLPYWSWENPEHRTIPAAYTSPNATSNPAFNPTREMSPTDTLQAWEIDQAEVANLMAIPGFSAFGGAKDAGGAVESGPHGVVHVEVGGDMGAFFTAGNDPLFYAHHCNVDKQWSDWIRASASHTNPTVRAFLNTKFFFYDENKVWTSIKVSDVLDHERTLGYAYGPPSFTVPAMRSQPTRLELPTNRSRQEITLNRQVEDEVKRSADQGTRLALHLSGLNLPAGESGIFWIFASDADARRGVPEGPGYLGYVVVVPNSKADASAGQPQGRPSVVLDVTGKLPELTSRNVLTPHVVRYVRGARPGPPEPLAVGVERATLLEQPAAVPAGGAAARD